MDRRRPRGAWLATALTLALAACGGASSARATSTAAPTTTQAPTTSSTTTTEPTTTTRPSTTTTAAPTTTWPRPDTPKLLRRGDRGAAVEAVQRRLAALGYWVGPVDGVFGPLTEQAVFAVQVDERRQLLLVVDDGRVRWVLNTSTGTNEHYTYGGRRYLADTPHGRWEVYRQIDGWRESHLGRLYKPKYFHRDGIALHGYTDVPPYAASHGCVRVTLAAIDWIRPEDVAPIGTAGWVY